MVNKIFTQPEQKLIENAYFRLIRKTEEFIEFQSINTNHCWIIKKSLSNPRRISLYHKHSITNPYYHKQRQCFSITEALTCIKAHDDYMLGIL